MMKRAVKQVIGAAVGRGIFWPSQNEGALAMSTGVIAAETPESSGASHCAGEAHVLCGSWEFFAL